MTNVDRIRTEHHVTCLVAPDSLLPIAQRIQRLMSHPRSFAVAHQYATYTGRAPEVRTGLTVAGIRDGQGIWVVCQPDFGFGVDVDDRAGDRCEADVWRRYHAGRHEADRFDDRRRFMTEVVFMGGREQDSPSRDDGIIIRRYNGDGVCDEKVIGFGEVAR